MDNLLSDTELNDFVLSQMPHFIAVNYQRLLTAQTPQEKVELALRTYNLGLRALTLGLVSQYLIRDDDRVSDPYLNELLLQKFPRLTLDAWQQLLFAALRAYEGKRALFFMPELYDFYWDDSASPPRQRVEVEAPFNRLTQLSLEHKTGNLLPRTEADWTQLAAETKSLLTQILNYLAFIGRYDLIRVLGYDEHSYQCERHKGLTLSIEESQPRPGHIELIEGWFYLRRETADFLLLHPLLLFWQNSDESGQVELLPAQTGVYDNFIQERLRYMLPLSGQMVEDNRSVQAFIVLLYDTIEEHKRQRQAADKLTWWQLRELCAEITRQRMSTVRHKYRAELYLPRDKTSQALAQFLDSDKRCFVLIGKSGVGKSNFLLALGETLARSRNDLCLLMYDGAHLGATASVTDVISRDFDDRLLLAGRRVEQIWRAIAQIDGIEQRRVILCVDAVNESQQAKELLRQLDELVQSPWPWLKVIFSSRPETWQAIKRGVRLTEALYYREAGAETLGVELEPFSYSEQMEPFSRQELPLAYAKYQQAFKLITPYESLSSVLREILRDPLNLWLVAKTYAGQAVPPALKTTELIAEYVDTLRRTERLRQDDLRLLEKQLVPLMVSPGRYRNALTVADIDAAGGGLYEAIYSEQILSDGQRMNQSFTNLLDADILTRQTQGRDQNITFRYERFYEYFVGRRIWDLSQTQKQKNRPYFFQDMINQTNRVPFLWGAVKYALVLETEKRGSETALALCSTNEQRVKEMMVNVFIDFGYDNPAKIDIILGRLLPPKERMGRLRSIGHLVGKINVPIDIRTRNARKIALEVASNLTILWVLQTGAVQADPTVRTAAVRYTYYLWQRYPNEALDILEYLAKIAIPGLLPNLVALESVLGLSIIILVDHSQDELTFRRLQEIWQSIISKVFGIRHRANRFESAVREFIRERVFSLVITVIFRLLRELPDFNVISYPALEAFFQLSDVDKQLYKRLIQYIDPEGTYTQEQMENDFLAAINVSNLLVESVILMSFTSHIAHSPLNFLSFLKIFFKKAKESSVPNPYLSIVPQTLLTILDHDPFSDEIFNLFVCTIEECRKYYSQSSWRLALRTTESPQAMYLGPYLICEYQRTDNINIEWLKGHIDSALEHNNNAFFKSLIETHLPLVWIRTRKPQIALDVLALFFNRCNSELEKMVRSFLVNLRIYYPDEVNDFLEEQDASDELRLQIDTTESNETLGEIIGIDAWLFFRDDVIIGSPALRDQLVDMFAEAANCKNIKEWLNYALREIINLIYGSEVLRPAK